MSIIEKIKFGWDSIGAVKNLINQWSPENCSSEKQYEKSLYEFLHENLSSIQVTKQYARGRIRADIVVDDNVIVELKSNLDTTGKYQRLIGQLAEYKSWKGPIIVLLCGKTEPNLRKQIDKYVSDEGLDDEMDGSGFLIIEK